MNRDSEVILASAGSGKTYRLSRRILALLAHGAAPSEIVALTFTRKAAAEFLARTLTTLASAATDTGAAEKLARELRAPVPDAPPPEEPERRFFQRLLEDTVAQAHRLRFGTMDGFFQNLVRSHPAELGIAGRFVLLDERRAAANRAARLRALLRAPARDEDAAREFLEAFRLATFGEEARGAAGRLDAFVRESLELFRETGDARVWGDADALWPDGRPWPPAPDETTRAALADSLDAALAEFTSGHKTLDKSLRGFAAAVRAHRPGARADALGTFATKTLLAPGALAALIQGRELTFPYSGKDRTLPAPLSRALGEALRGVLAAEFETRLRRTAGAGRLLATYAAAHEAETLASGALGFSDIVHLLAKPENAPVLENAAYRLDGETRHWLFDEFQDTSRRAWRILGACAAEALACGDGTRSVFFVGDTKQAIYAWNGGDHRLLPEIRARHALPALDLFETRRCGPEVIALVNAVCGRFADAPGMPEAAAADWRENWRDHVCDERARANVGLARWITVEKPGRDADESSAERRMAPVIDRIREADFLDRGESAGLLTLTNAEATEAAAILRRAGIPCVCETDTAPALDNPVTLALLAAIRHAAHPGDTVSRETVAMSPLAGRIRGEATLRRITEAGVETTLREILRDHAAVMPTDEFTRRRLAALLDIAREYDESGERDAAEFARFAAATRRRDIAAAGRVQVMTVHKSKGLEFDAVFLPFLEGDPVDTVDAGGFEALRDAPDAPPRVVLAMPPAALCEADPELRRALDARRASAAYECLCSLYVALTRAKRELTLVSHPPAKRDDETRAPSRTGLLAHAFDIAPDTPCGELFATGAKDRAVGKSPPSPPPVSEPEEPAPGFPPRPVASTLTPSALKRFVDSAPGETDAREFGTEVHRILRNLTTIPDDEPPESLRARLAEASASDATDPARHARALDTVMRVLNAPAFRAAFHDTPGATVRTELPFAFMRDDDTLVSGVFDRIVIAPNGSSATVYDFKTDALPPETLRERYGDAMRLYREAACALLGLPPDKVVATLLQTGSGEAVRVTSETQ